MFRNLTLFIAILVFTGACTFEPRYRQVHDLIPPASQQGKTCAATCRTNQLLCEQRNATDYNFCEQRSETNYQRCVTEQTKEHQRCVAETKYEYRKADDPDSYVAAFCNRIGPANCHHETCVESPRNCGAPHRQCFSGCGGTVKTRSVCVANCP